MAEKDPSKDATTKEKMRKCKVCHIQFTDADAYIEHLESSKDHKKKLLKEKYGPKYLEAKEKLDSSQMNVKLSDEKPEEKLQQEQDSSIDSNSEEEAEVYTCHLCKKICTGLISYQLHLKGNKHQKAMHNAKLRKKMTDDISIPKPSNEEPSKEDSLLDMVLINKDYQYASQDIECKICHVKCSGPASYRQHCKGFAHQKKIATNDLMTKLKSEDGHQLPEGDGSLCCDICQKAFSGPLPYQQHMDGIQHLRRSRHVEELSKIQDLIINDEEDSKKFHCKECGTSFSGPVPFQAHLQSTVHAKLMKKTSQMKSLENHADLVKFLASDEDSEEGTVLACKVCHTAFSGPEAAKDHFRSVKHKKVAKKKAQLKKLRKVKAAINGNKASGVEQIDSSDSSDSEFDIIH